VCPTGREPTDHIRDGDPHMADARTATALARLDRDDVLVFHGASLTLFSREGSAQRHLPTLKHYRHTHHVLVYAIDQNRVALHAFDLEAFFFVKLDRAGVALAHRQLDPVQPKGSRRCEC
jgi:hypothetical protein